MIKLIKSDNYFILLLNKGNIVIYRNGINNGDDDKNSDNNNNSASYNVNKIKLIVLIKTR